MMERDCMNDCGMVDGFRAAVKPWEEGEFRVFRVEQGGCAFALVVARGKEEAVEPEDVRCYFALDDESMSREEREVEVFEHEPHAEITIRDEEGLRETRTAREWAAEAKVPMGIAWSDV